jgi:two-component system, response regulator FlrC
MDMQATQTAGRSGELVKTILVVDDDPLIVDLLSRILQRRGYGVLTADCAQQARDIFELNQVELVISDIQMPDLDGLALTRHLKTVAPRLPVLLMTGDRTRYDDIDASMAGADGFITKPFTTVVLLALVSSLIS